MKTNTEIASLVTRVQSGDLPAAELLYETFAKGMFLVSFRITNNRMLSEDVLQEAFVKSFTKISSLKDKAKYGAWLKQIVVRKSIDLLKKSKSWVDLDEQNEAFEENEAPAIEGLNSARINQAIATLPEKSRAVFSLYLIEGYTHAEVAEILAISVSTSKSQYRYALQLLRKNLDKDALL